MCRYRCISIIIISTICPQVCRVADLRPTHLIESHVSAYVVRREVTGEGEQIPHHLYSIEFGTDLDGTQDFFQMYWPIVLSHR